MDKFNAIKILEEEFENKKIFDKNLSKEHYMNSVYDFFDNYILTKFTSLFNQCETFNKIDNKLKEMLFEKSKLEAIYIINDLSLVNDYDDDSNKIFVDNGQILHWLNKNEIGFLKKEKSIKIKVASKLSNIFITMLEDNISNEEMNK